MLTKQYFINHFRVLLVKLGLLDLLENEENEEKVARQVLSDLLVCLVNLDLQACKDLLVKKARMELRVQRVIVV